MMALSSPAMPALGCGVACSPAARASAAPVLNEVFTGRSRLGGRPSVLTRHRSPTAHNSARFATRAAVVDPATKISFADEVDGLTCIGAGVREKKIAILSIKVYSVAMYVDKAAAAAAGGDLLMGDFTKRAVVEMARAVDGLTFWSALNEAVDPRLARIATDQATAEDADGNFMAEVAEVAEKNEDRARVAAVELGNFLGGVNLGKGSVVSVTWAPGGALTVAAGGAEKSFESAELAQAIFDVYVGDDPISPAALSAFKAGFAKL